MTLRVNWKCLEFLIIINILTLRVSESPNFNDS
jgi:hypothetical protein